MVFEFWVFYWGDSIRKRPVVKRDGRDGKVLVVAGLGMRAWRREVVCLLF